MEFVTPRLVEPLPVTLDHSLEPMFAIADHERHPQIGSAVVRFAQWNTIYIEIHR